MSIFPQRPILMARMGRIYRDRFSFGLVMILAPFPNEEQALGSLCAAICNLSVELQPSWPFVRWHLYAADRLAPWGGKPPA